MAWRLDKSVVRGEIDNSHKGRVTGRIWLCGREDPIDLELEGNCHEDIAGCSLKFTNPDPCIADEHTELNGYQSGRAGDITASRKVRVFDVPLEEAFEMKERGEKPPEHKSNCLYLEWYSQMNGRVVIESPDYEIEVSEHAWNLTAEEKRGVDQQNADNIGNWMQMLGDALRDDSEEDEVDYPDDDYGGELMDEWGWEQFLRDLDDKVEKFSHLLAQYKGNPEVIDIIENEFGWEIDEELIEELDELGDQLGMDEFVEPDPLREGKDWVRNREGRIEHPLVKDTDEGIERFVQRIEADGILDEEDDDLLDMLSEAQLMMVKMAGVLNNIAYGMPLDNAFVVATLKRALKYFDRSMAASEAVEMNRTLTKYRLQEFRQFMFNTRMAVLDTMESLRKNHK